MATLELHYSSQAIGRQTGLAVITPDRWDGAPLPVLYLLHGLSDGFSTWHRRTALERHLQAHRMLVVLPDGARGWYTNAHSIAADQYEDHILEVVERVDGLFNTIRDRSGRGIGGLSMGGYGATKIGLKHADRFGSVHSHSGVLDIRLRWEQAPHADMNLIFGHEVGDNEDCFHLARQAEPRPALHIDCGTEDFLIEHNRRFHAHLDEIGYPHQYAEYPGAHDWGYWDTHIVAALAFHAEHFAKNK